MNRHYYVLKGALIAVALCIAMVASSWEEQAYRPHRNPSPYTAVVTMQAAVVHGGARLAQYAHAFLRAFH